MTQTEQLIQWLERGGVMMYPIIACSILFIAILMERIIVLGIIDYGFSTRINALRVAILDRGIDAIKDRTRAVSVCVRPALTTAEQEWSASPKRIQEALTHASHIIRRRLESRLNSLAVISQVTPLLGLLGTVIGMVSAFLAVEQSGSSASPAVLAGGIWEALLTTVFGLSVAIPAYLSWHGLERVVNHRLESLEELTDAILTTHEEERDE